MQQTNTHVSTPPAGYHPVTRWLHAGLVLGVIFQLACASMMAHPDYEEGEHRGIAKVHAVAAAHAEVPSADMHQSGHKEDVLGKWLMGAHRAGGIFVALIVLANLLWAVVPRGNPRKRQLPVLFSALHWSEAVSIAKQLPMMVTKKRPLPEPGNSLSLIVEMFGMLTMAVMALTGAIVWNMWAGPGSKVSGQAEFWMEAHGAIAVLLLLYLAGHISMALMHARAGDEVFARILPSMANKKRCK